MSPINERWSDPTAPPSFRQTVYRDRFSDGTEPIDVGYPDGTSPGSFSDRPVAAAVAAVSAPAVVLPDDLTLAVDFGLPAELTSPSGPPPLGPTQALLRTPGVLDPAGPRAKDARQLDAQRQVMARQQESAQRQSVAQRQAWVDRQPVLTTTGTSRFSRTRPAAGPPPAAPATAQTAAQAAGPARVSRLAGWSAPSPTVPWTAGTTTGQLPGAATWRTTGPRPVRGQVRSKRRGAWLGLLLLAVLIFLGNGGAKVISGIFNPNAVPDGAKNIVATYYREVGQQAPTVTATDVCPAHRPVWLAGQGTSTSDSKRGVAFDHQESAKKVSGGYSVTASVLVGNEAQTVTVAVTKLGSAYYVCSGITP